MSIHALAVHPAPIEYIPDARFADQLRSCGFLGDEFDLHGQLCYRPGNGFFEHIRFEGSHSVVSLTPDPAGGFIESEPQDSCQHCRIELVETPGRGVMCGCNLREPRCSTCGYEIGDGIPLIGNWFKSNQLWTCPSCGGQFAPYDLDWQHTAGFSSFRIDVRQIYEGEAAPSAEFLRQLRSITGCDWRYFWYHL